MAFYGNGLLPVMRVGLSDGALFEAAIVRFEEQAGSQMTVAELAGQSYRYFDAEELRIVIAVVEDQAVFALVPAEFDDAQTGRALGLTLPDSSIAESTVLQDIISKYDYTNHVVGFVDIAAIAERFVGQPTGLDVDLMALLEQDDTEPVRRVQGRDSRHCRRSTQNGHRLHGHQRQTIRFEALSSSFATT